MSTSVSSQHSRDYRETSWWINPLGYWFVQFIHTVPQFFFTLADILRAMAEAVISFGLASSIIQLIDISSRIVKRLRDFSSHMESLPSAFRNMQITLPLILDILKRTRQQSDFGEISQETQLALIPLLNGCHQEVQRLEEMLTGLLPHPLDSRFKKTGKAVASIWKEKKIEGILSALQRLLQVLTCHQVSLSSARGGVPLKPLFMLPFTKDSNFVGRTEVLEMMQERILDEGHVALAGIGGVGKSQVAIEYCYSYRVQHPQRHIFWIHAGSVARIEEGYRNIARALSLPGWSEPSTNVCKIVDDWLLNKDHGPWLLVIDSADDMSLFYGSQSDTEAPEPNAIALSIRRLILDGSGSIIFTTRDMRLGQRLTHGSHPVVVHPMDNEDAKQLLRARGAGSTPSEDKAQILVAMLGHLPLAISQAAAFISENQTSVETYLEILRSTRLGMKRLLEENLTDPRRDVEIKNSVLETWQISFDQVARQSVRAATILSTMAVLSQGAVPSALLHQEGESLLEFTKAIGILRAFSLIHSDPEEVEYWTHDLVQLATLAWLSSRGTRITYNERALDTLADKFPPGESELWDQCKKLFPHACVVEKYASSSPRMSLQKAKLRQKMANYLRVQDLHDLAIIKHEEAASELRLRLGRDCPEAFSNISDLALLLHHKGRFREAEKLHRRALVGIKKSRSQDDPYTLYRMLRLAECLTFQSKFAAAERIYSGVYTSRKATLGEQHLDTLMSLSYWGSAIEILGKFEESESANRRAVEGMQAVLPPNHGMLAHAEFRLATVLQRVGKSAEAETVCRRSVESGLARYGPDNSRVAVSMQTLALALRDQGQYEEATSLCQRIVHIRERALTPHHILTMSALYSLAFLYHGRREYCLASSTYLECLSRLEQTYGAFHPLSIVTRAQYLRMLENMRDKEFNKRTYANPRDLWMSLSPRQIRPVVQTVGVWDPQKYSRNCYLEIFDAYCFVGAVYIRQYCLQSINNGFGALTSPFIMLCESIFLFLLDNKVSSWYQKG